MATIPWRSLLSDLSGLIWTIWKMHKDFDLPRSQVPPHSYTELHVQNVYQWLSMYIVMWVMCVYEQCMSMCTCTRIDAPSPWWQGAAPTWTLEVLKLQWHPQIRWIFMIFLTKLEQIGKGTDTGLIPVYPHAAHALLILLVLLPQLPVALSLAFSRWAEKKSDFFFGQTGHATILLRFLQYFSVIFPSRIANPIVILADDPKDTSLICTWNASSSQLLGAVASPPGSSEWSFDFGWCGHDYPMNQYPK